MKKCFMQRFELFQRKALYKYILLLLQTYFHICNSSFHNEIYGVDVFSPRERFQLDPLIRALFVRSDRDHTMDFLLMGLCSSSVHFIYAAELFPTVPLSNCHNDHEVLS